MIFITILYKQSPNKTVINFKNFTELSKNSDIEILHENNV